MASIATAQYALNSSTATQVVTRSTDPFVDGSLIRNLDTSISVYVGPTSAVTTSTGMLLKAGESISIDGDADVYAISASSTPSVAVLLQQA